MDDISATTKRVSMHVHVLQDVPLICTCLSLPELVVHTTGIASVSSTLRAG